MSSHDAISAVISALESEGISYMMVGAFSRNAYGIPRSTNDADVVRIHTTRNALLGGRDIA